MKQAAEDAHENDLDIYNKMKSIARAYTTKREVSVQEAVYLVMPELWLRKVFPGVLFANSNVPLKRFRICLSKTEIEKLPEESTVVFKRNMLDRYCDRPDSTFANGRYFVLDSFCFAQFLRYYSLKHTEINDCQPNELTDDLIESNHPLINYPKTIPLMNSSEKLNCRKVPLVLKYYEPNKEKSPEDYAHHLLFLFYPFRKEEQLMSDISQSYVEKLNEAGVIDIVNRNRQNIEPFSEMVHQAFEQFLNNQNTLQSNSFELQENEEVLNEYRNDESNENCHDSHLNITSGPSTEPVLLSDDDINVRIRGRNNQQRDLFTFVHKWAIDYVKNLNCQTPIRIDPFKLFVTGGGGVGKSHLLITIVHSVRKILMYKGGEPSKERILVLAPTGVAAVNVNGTTLHSGLVIPTRGKLYPLSDKTKTSLRIKLSCIELIVIDEISMVSNKLFREVDLRLRKIFCCDLLFGGKPIILCGDLYQLPPVQGKPVYVTDKTHIQGILGFDLWREFSMAELTEVMRQRDDINFVQLLNQIRIGKLDEESTNLLKSRFVGFNNLQYPQETIHIYAENAPSL